MTENYCGIFCFAGSASVDGHILKDDDDDDERCCNEGRDGTSPTRQLNVDHYNMQHPHPHPYSYHCIHHQHQQQHRPEALLKLRHTATAPLSRTQHFFHSAAGSSNHTREQVFYFIFERFYYKKNTLGLV